MFIKHGDGKIVSVIEEDDLTEMQKKSVKDLSEQNLKLSENKSSSENKNLGDN